MPGLTLAVSKEGQLIYEKAFGFADVDHNKLMSNDTRIRVASVSKVITATALGKLISDGLLDIDKPIGHYVQYLDKKYKNLTIRHLAGHTSGVPHRPKGRKHGNTNLMSIKSSAMLSTGDLKFEPNDSYEYSTHGYNLIAAVIEAVGNKPFTQYLDEEIFGPLKMNSTKAEDLMMLDDLDSKIYYLKNDKLLEDKKPKSGSFKLAGAGFRSTASDLVKMMNAYNSNIISSDVVGQLFESNTLNNGEKTNVGIGWRKSIDAFGYEVIEHAGSWNGARSVLVHYPNEKNEHFDFNKFYLSCIY